MVADVKFLRVTALPLTPIPNALYFVKAANEQTGQLFVTGNDAVPVPFTGEGCPTISVTGAPYFADNTGINSATAAIQEAIDDLYDMGGGTLVFPDGLYRITASTTGETFDNDGVVVPASQCGIIQRAGVSLVAANDYGAKIYTNDNTLFLIAQIAPVKCGLSGFEIYGTWLVGQMVAGHGVFTLSTAGGADRSCRDNVWERLRIHNVASYGIGLQAGSPLRCRLSDIDVWDVGADGLDLKSRSDATEPVGNIVENIRVRNHGQRVTGSNGVDLRGIWQASNITVTDFGGNATLDYGGVRFRTKPGGGDPTERVASRSTLSQVYVKPTQGAAANTIVGVQNGSDNISISQVVTDDCTRGYEATGNVNGNAQSATVQGFIALNSREYGFFLGVDCTDQTLSCCHSAASVTAGIRNNATRSKIIGHSSINETKITSSVAAAATEIIQGGALGSETGVSETSPAAGRAGLKAVGPSANIDFVIDPKGTGVIRSGTVVATADAPITSYFPWKDSSGVTRKIAVIS